MPSSARRWIPVAVALAGLVAGIAWIASRRDHDPLAAEGYAKSAAPRNAALAGPEDALAAPGQPAERESVAASRPETLETAKPPSRQATVRGRFVDHRGLAIPGVRVAERRGSLATKTDELGLFELTLAPAAEAAAWRGVLVARCRGFAVREIPVEAPAGEAKDLGDLVLDGGADVLGRVVDGGGAPAAEARVLATAAGLESDSARLFGPSPSLAEARSDGRGEFLLEGVAEGRIRVWAKSDDSHWSSSAELDVVARQDMRGLEVRLEPYEPEDLIELVVLQPDGAPASQARIDYQYRGAIRSGSGGGTADGAGRYRHPVHLRVPHDFTATDRGRRFAPARVLQVPPGARGVEVRLGEARTMLVRVRDEAGEPVARFAAQTFDDGGWNVSARTKADGSAGGEAELGVPGWTFRVRVDAEGYALAELGPFEPASAPEVLDVRLASLPGVRGRVTRGGEGLAGAKVGLHDAPGERTKMIVNGFPARSERLAGVSGTTDANGAFHLSPRKGGRFFLRAEKEGLAPAELGPLEIDPLVALTRLEIALGPGGAIEGTVLVPASVLASGVIVGISRGDGCAVTQRADSDGRFRFERLMPGRWLVRRCEAEISPSSTASSSTDAEEPEELPWSVVVREGETARCDLDLRQEVRAVLAGRILFSGRAVAGLRAALAADGSFTAKVQGAVDLDGSFRLECSPPGRYRLTIQQASTDSPLVLIEELELAAGSNPWSRDIPAGRISGRSSSGLPQGQASIRYAWQGQGPLIWISIQPQADGSFDLPVVPAGKGRFHCTLPDGTTKEVEVDLSAGGMLFVELP